MLGNWREHTSDLQEEWVFAYKEIENEVSWKLDE